MREEEGRRARIVSQALFGEEVEVVGGGHGGGGGLGHGLGLGHGHGHGHGLGLGLGHGGGGGHGVCVCIRTPDGYQGWVREGSFVERTEYSTNLEVGRLSAHLYAEADTEYGPIMTLPFGSRLMRVDTDSRWHRVILPDGREAFIQRGDVEGGAFDLKAFCQKFLGLPYTWGGRSSFGYDCSGFVQMLYGRLGKSIPRDARQQIVCGRPVEELQLGDLIFWGKSENEIKHVGMFLEGESFIHSSVRENKPYLRVSLLTDFEWSGRKEAYYPFRTARRLD